MDKPLTTQVVIEKMSDDFNTLSQFVMIVNNLPPSSHVEYNELEGLTKEMNACDYLSESHWKNIMNLERRIEWFL